MSVPPDANTLGQATGQITYQYHQTTHLLPTVDGPEEQGRHGGEGAKRAVSQGDVAGLEQVEE
jgi:hypothetical protein